MGLGRTMCQITREFVWRPTWGATFFECMDLKFPTGIYRVSFKVVLMKNSAILVESC